MRHGKRVLATLLLVALAGSATSVTVVNSNDWTEVYSGIQSQYAEDTDEDIYFARSPRASSLVRKMPKRDVTILRSEQNPMSPNMRSILESNGFEVTDQRTIGDFPSELAPEEINELYLVPSGIPSAALAAGPLSKANDSWTYVVTDSNVDGAVQLAESASEVHLLGRISRSDEERLVGLSDSYVESSDPTNISIESTKRFLEENPEESRFYLSDGNFLESEMLKGDYPVLISGSNKLPEQLQEYLLQSPQHSLNTAVAIGAHMTSVGTEIRDQNVTRRGETMDEKISVFVKYGTARGSSQQIYALNLFPLPTGQGRLEVGNVSYNPVSDQLRVNYVNTGRSRVYSLSTLRVLSREGGSLASVGDTNPILVGPGESVSRTYNAELRASEYGDALVEFSTSYGPRPERLDTYLTESGRFSPPVTRNLSVREFEASSNVTVGSVMYLRDAEGFEIKLVNNRDSESFASAALRQVSVDGTEESFLTDEIRLEPGESATTYVSVDLDEIDRRRNEELDVRVRHGSRESVLPNTQERTVDVTYANRGIPSEAVVGVAAIALVVAVVILSRRGALDLPDPREAVRTV